MLTTFIVTQIILLNGAFTMDRMKRSIFIFLGILNLVIAYFFEGNLGFQLFGVSGIVWMAYGSIYLILQNRKGGKV